MLAACRHLGSVWALCLQRSGSKHTTTPADNYYLARRRTLQVVVSSLLTEAGFESAEKAAVETLTEMLQSCESPCHRCGDLGQNHLEVNSDLLLLFLLFFVCLFC